MSVRRPLLEAAWALAAALAPPIAGVLVGGPWLFPLLATFLFYPLFLRLTRERRLPAGLSLALLWAGALSAASITLAHFWPERYEAAVWHGAAYRAEMLAWVRTGVGAEGEIRRFLPQHLVHLLLFVLLTALTRGAAGLLLGVLLLNYMNAYVGALTRLGNPVGLGLLGWHPWAVLRVVAFLLAAFLIVTPRRAEQDGRSVRQVPSRRGWLVVAALLAADILVKWVGAPAWRRLILEQIDR